jgi:WD40 repeat protein
VLAASGLPFVLGEDPKPAQPAPRRDYQAKWAVIIGIGDYPTSSGLGPLRSPPKGATALHQLLVQELGFPKDHVAFLPDKKADRAAVIEAMTWPRGKGPQAGDAIMVFFAGHGLLDREGKGYLATVDADVKDPAKTCVSVAGLRDLVGRLPCGHKLIILDCCYSGSLFREGMPAAPAGRGKSEAGDAGGSEDPLDHYLSRPAFVGLSSGLLTPVREEGEGDDYSVFTSALLAELRDRADTRRADHAFTFGQLAPRVRERVTAKLRGRQIPAYGSLAPDADGDFVFRPSVRRLTPSERSARRKYALTMRSLPLVWEAGEVALTRRLLDEARPEPDREDLRGFEWFHWHKRTHSERLALPPTTAGFSGVTYSPDGKFFATAGSDGFVRVHNADSGKEVAAHRKHPTWVTGPTWSPDGSRLASAGYRVTKNPKGEAMLAGEIKVFDPLTGHDDCTLETDAASRVAFSRNGKHLAAVTMRHLGKAEFAFELSLWEVATRKKVFTRGLEKPGTITSFSFDPSGDRLAVIASMADGRPKCSLWDFTGKEVRAFGDPAHWVHAHAFHPQEDLIATACSEVGKLGMVAEVTLWRFSTGRAERKMRGHTADITNMAFSSDGEYLVTASWDKTVIIWRTETGEERVILRGHTQPIMGVAFRPNMLEVVSVTAGRSPPAVGPGNIPSEQFVKLTRRTDDPAEVKVWDVGKASEGANFPSEGSQVMSVAFRLPDGKQLMAGYRFGGIRVWDAPSGEVVYDLKEPKDITTVAYSPDGGQIAVGGAKNFYLAGEKGTLSTWDTKTWRQKLNLTVDCGGVYGLAFRPDGKVVTAACWDVTNPVKPPPGDRVPGMVGLSYSLLTMTRPRGQVRGWGVGDGREVLRLKEEGSGVTSVAYAPRGDRLAWATWQLYVHPDEFSMWGQLWVADQDGKGAKKVGEHRGLISALAFSPDGSRIASAGADGIIQIWDPAGIAEKLVLRGHIGQVTAIAFSPDGKRIASGGTDKTVKLWDTTAGHELVTLAGHVNVVSAVAFSPDGRAIAAGSYNGHVRVWRAPLQN